MATTSAEGPTFSRLTEGRKTQSWRAAIPVVVVVVALVAVLAYLASRLSSYSQQFSEAQREAAAARQSAEGMQKQMAQLQRELAMARSAGRVTVVLQAVEKGKSASKAWGAATWGELNDGTSWLRLSTYGLPPPAPGKVYDAWLEPTSGAPVFVGRLDVDQEGSAFVMASGLPAVDQGKRVFVSLDSEGAKAPEKILFEAPLPPLKPVLAAK
jgi:type II secretory pathway pseudopilin PulG